MLKKMKIAAIAAIVLLIGSSAVAIVGNSLGWFKAAGNYVDINSGKVLAEISQKKIHQGAVNNMFNNQKLILEMELDYINKTDGLSTEEKENHKNQIIRAQKTEEQILDDLIFKEVILSECEKLEIKVDRNEAYKKTLNDYKILEDMISKGNEREKIEAQQMLDVFSTYAKGMGVSLQKFQSKYQTDSTVRAMLIEKHFEYYQKNLYDGSNKEDSSISQSYLDYMEKVKSTYDIKVH